MCGEQRLRQLAATRRVGSPPRVRGTDAESLMERGQARITPACAGNRLQQRQGPQKNKDHPRVCGEQLYPYRALSASMGSPPRVRGTDCPAANASCGCGITPACAGNRIRRKEFNTIKKDHPRVCGEQCVRRESHPRLSGSPPRVRGTGTVSKLPRGFQGITPACAGNSRVCRKSGMDGRDHPRVCGEQSHALALLLFFIGSPPRVRGTGGIFRVQRHDARITPACAGNRYRAGPRRVH